MSRHKMGGVSGEMIHATSIVVGQTGLLFTGPSGIGKTSTAFACLQSARARGWYCALVADDQTMLTVTSGRPIASCLQPIRGILEIRGTGIVSMRSIEQAVVHVVIALRQPSSATRIPPEREVFTLPGHATPLPLISMWKTHFNDPLEQIICTFPEQFFAF